MIPKLIAQAGALSLSCPLLTMQAYRDVAATAAAMFLYFATLRVVCVLLWHAMRAKRDAASRQWTSSAHRDSSIDHNSDLAPVASHTDRTSSARCARKPSISTYSLARVDRTVRGARSCWGVLPATQRCIIRVGGPRVVCRSRAAPLLTQRGMRGKALHPALVTAVLGVAAPDAAAVVA